MTNPFDPATILGDRYRLIERVAVGGQGEVWRAYDTALGRTVAMKLLRGDYTHSAEFRDRFRREARNAAALSHPGVAHVFDYDDGSGDTPPYLVMEYVDGEALSATIAREAPLGPERVLHIIGAVASALAVAHAAGLVHRDVKPGNLLVGRDGSIKITDFGIARAVDAAPLTRTGMMMGTPLYLAPEQAAGRPATAAGDLYALGVIAYELLTGRPPYEGPAPAVLLAHRDSPLPELPRSVPPGLRDLVLTLTSKDPAMRPPGAAAVVEHVTRMRADPVGRGMHSPQDLRSAPVGWPDPAQNRRSPGNVTQVLERPSAVAERSTRGRAVPLVLGGAAIALMAGLVGWFARPLPSTPPDEQPEKRPVATAATASPARRRPSTHQPPVHRTSTHRSLPRHARKHHPRHHKHHDQ